MIADFHESFKEGGAIREVAHHPGLSSTKKYEIIMEPVQQSYYYWYPRFGRTSNPRIQMITKTILLTNEAITSRGPRTEVTGAIQHVLESYSALFVYSLQLSVV